MSSIRFGATGDQFKNRVSVIPNLASITVLRHVTTELTNHVVHTRAMAFCEIYSKISPSPIYKSLSPDTRDACTKDVGARFINAFSFAHFFLVYPFLMSMGFYAWIKSEWMKSIHNNVGRVNSYSLRVAGTSFSSKSLRLTQREQWYTWSCTLLI